jgi:hypothetical protein
MTEAASQHTNGIGELTASLCKRSSTSPRCVLLPGPAGPFLLKDAARPRHVSHTDDWIGCAKSSARPGRPDLGAPPTSCSSGAVRRIRARSIHCTSRPPTNPRRGEGRSGAARNSVRGAGAYYGQEYSAYASGPDCLNSSPSGYVCAARVIKPQAGQSARNDGNVATVIGPAGRPRSIRTVQQLREAWNEAGHNARWPVAGAGRRSGSERGGRRRT